MTSVAVTKKKKVYLSKNKKLLKDILEDKKNAQETENKVIKKINKE